MAKYQEPAEPNWVRTNKYYKLFVVMMLILLTFFIMLATRSHVDDSKLKAAQGSISGSFGFLTAGIKEYDGQGNSDGLNSSSPEINQLRAILGPILADETARLTYRHDKIVVSLGADKVFSPDSEQLLATGEELIIKIGQIAAGLQVPLIIEAHTSDQAPSNSDTGDNWQLSMSRDASVLKVFTEQGSIPVNRLSAYGYAGFRPIVLNTSPQARIKNNRLDLIFYLSGDSSQEALKKLNKNRKSLNIDGFDFFIKDPEMVNN